MMMAWSTATICMPAMTSGAGFAVCRFFIGLSEAPFFPGITLSMFSCIRPISYELELTRNSDIVMVHQRGESHAHGYLACRKYHVEYLVWVLGCWYLDKYGRGSRSPRLAMVLHHRRRCIYSCSRWCLLSASIVAAQHQMADPRRERDGHVPRPSVQRRP